MYVLYIYIKFKVYNVFICNTFKILLLFFNIFILIKHILNVFIIIFSQNVLLNRFSNGASENIK